MTLVETAIVEVAPRDGLQNEKRNLPSDAKLALIADLLSAGARRIEVASFVNPRAVPNMADAEAVIEGLPDALGARFIGLMLNRRGLARAIAARDRSGGRLHEAGCVAVASDAFGIRNQGMTVGEALAETGEMLRLARRNGLMPQATIAVAFGCPFEGMVDPDTVVAVAQALADAGAEEIALADTIGVAVPAQVTDLFGMLAEAVPGVPLRAHFHNTRGTGIANAWAALSAGVPTLDSSLGGIGGCPFAPRATGNIATEDLVYMLERSGIRTGFDMQSLRDANDRLSAALGKELPALSPRADPFPADQFTRMSSSRIMS